jgi:hypothetical protein
LNAAPRSPAARPTASMAIYWLKGSTALGARPNTGALPKKAHMTALAAKLAKRALVSMMGDTLRWSSSMQKSTPASGALKAALMPAAAPAVTRKRFISSLPERSLSAAPVSAPSCMDGPSRPKDSPAPRAKLPPKNLKGSSLFQSMPMRRIRPAFICGMPEPLMRGARLTMSAVQRPSAKASPSQSSAPAMPDAATGAMSSRRLSSPCMDFLYATIIKPDTTPTRTL